MRDVLDADAVRRWSRAAVTSLAEHRTEIDALNVFPVPDGDTGRNLLVTAQAADDRLQAAAAKSAAAALTALASGAARGAIGNSGFLLSQVLRGLAEAASATDDCDARAVVTGLDAGARLSRAAVATPVEGTMLTVARAAADGAATALDDTVVAVLVAAVRAADLALQETTGQLVELAEAGVVDAGGRGLLLVLAALAQSVGAAPQPLRPVHVPARRALAAGSLAPPHAGPDAAFEVQYLLDAPGDGAGALRGALSALGTSVAVVPVGTGTWKVHVHAAEAGPAIEAGLEAGRVHGISVVRLTAVDTADDAGVPAARRVVAIAPGPGLADLVRAEGVLVADGADGADTTDGADSIRAALPAGVRDAVLLVPAERSGTAGESAAAELRRHGIRVSVVPVRSPVQALAAIAVHDPARRFDDDVVAMAEAAAATRFAEITVAGSAALTAVGLCQPGDVLGLIDGDVVRIGHGLLDVALDVLDRLLGIGAELITVLVGDGAPRETATVLERHVRARSRLTDVVVYRAGPLDPPLVLGAE